MGCFHLILWFACVFPTLSIKIDMQGSIKMGRDVVETLEYLMKNKISYSRRSGNKPGLVDNNKIIRSLVDSAFLCREVDFCKDHQIVNEYVISLAAAIENIFKDVSENYKHNAESIIIEDELKSIKEVKHLVSTVSDTQNNEGNVYNWLDFMKKINAKFRERSLAFAYQNLDGSPTEINAVKKKLTQKITVALTEIELEYQRKLCSEQKICTTNYECTKSLDSLLERIANLSESRTKKFIGIFSEALLDTSFYNLLSDETAREFQLVLNDMAYAQNIPSKKVLEIVHKTVKQRKEFVKNNVQVTGGSDVKILHVILSDLDHFYYKTAEPFEYFFESLDEWSDNDGAKLSGPMRKVMSDILKKMASEPELLLRKLINEVKVFLEITVDPVEEK